MRKSMRLIVVILVMVGLGACAKQTVADQPEAGKETNQNRAEELFQLGEKWATAEHGKGTQDWNKALDYYRQAAELGHSGAMVCLGDCYALGIGIKKDVTEAIVWYYKAAELENPAAFWGLVQAYGEEYRNGINKNNAEIERELERWGQRYDEFCEAQKDPTDPVVQYLLGQYFRRKAKTEEGRNEAVKWFRKSAEQGYAPAQYILGWKYSEMDWCHKAAEQGYAPAQYALGLCYRHGYPCYGTKIEKDAISAVKWLRKAAEQGYAPAQNVLGCCYRDGFGVEKDEREAVAWILKAVEQQYDKACLSLGNCYLDGIGVEKDEREAVKWFCKAAELELGYGLETSGLHALKGMAEQRKNVEKETLEELAEQGSPSAPFWLARCYEDGIGVEKDENEAVKWYRKAGENGNYWAIMSLGRLVENNSGALQALKELAEKGKSWAVFVIEQNAMGNIDALKILKELAEKGNATAKKAWEEQKGLLNTEE